MMDPTFHSYLTVRTLDRPASSGKRTRDLEAGRRFAAAVPDYVVLLMGTTGLPLDTFVSGCLGRWADRWSNIKLDDVSPDDLRNYFRTLLQRGHTPREIDKEKTLLRSFYRWARRCGWALADPTAKLDRSRARSERRSIAWTSDEQQCLLEACRARPAATEPPGSGSPSPPPYLHPLVLLGLRTGLRLGHLLHLEWRHVDLQAGRILIPAGETKSGREIDLPLDRDCRALLTQLAQRAQSHPAVPRRVLDVDGLPLWQGEPDEHAAIQAFRRAGRQAAIPDADFGSVRFTFVYNCAHAGVPMSHVLRVGEWDDPTLLERIYEETAAEAKEPVVDGPPLAATRNN